MVEREAGSEILRGQRRHAIAAAFDHQVHRGDRRLRLASTQIPARAFRNGEMHQQGHDAECETARQRDQPEALRVVRQQKSHERQNREGAGQHDFIYRAIRAAVLRRHQFGRDRKRGGNGEAQTDAGDKAQDRSGCSAVCASGISNGEQRARSTTPICMISLRLQSVGERRGDEAADDTTRKVGPATSQRMSSPVRCKRLFGQPPLIRRAAECQES